MTTNQTSDAKSRWTPWPPVPRPTTNGALGLAEFAAKTTNPVTKAEVEAEEFATCEAFAAYQNALATTTTGFHRCSCGMAIYGHYTQCESCEFNECPACGVKAHFFCSECIANGTKDEAIVASERWAQEVQS